jgi:hypothetical protein
VGPTWALPSNADKTAGHANTFLNLASQESFVQGRLSSSFTPFDELAEARKNLSCLRHLESRHSNGVQGRSSATPFTTAMSNNPSKIRFSSPEIIAYVEARHAMAPSSPLQVGKVLP